MKKKKFKTSKNLKWNSLVAVRGDKLVNTKSRKNALGFLMKPYNETYLKINFNKDKTIGVEQVDVSFPYHIKVSGTLPVAVEVKK